MDRYVVPQFIDVEDKIIGPITVRQFIICTIGAMFIFISYKLSDFSLFLLQTFLIGLFVIVMAFVKVNGKLFHEFFVDLLFYLFKVQKLSIWQKIEDTSKNMKENKKIEDDYIFIPKDFSRKKLSEISLIIDTGGVYVGESEDKKLSSEKTIINNTI